MPFASGPPPPRLSRNGSVESLSSVDSVIDEPQHNTSYATSGERDRWRTPEPELHLSVAGMAVLESSPTVNLEIGRIVDSLRGGGSGTPRSPTNASALRSAANSATEQELVRRATEIARERAREVEDERRRREEPDPGYFIGGAFDRWLNDPPDLDEDFGYGYNLPTGAGTGAGAGAPGAPRLPYAQPATFTFGDAGFSNGGLGPRILFPGASGPGGLQPAVGRASGAEPSRRVSDPMDLAGCCFAPDGSYVYAASESCVAEWGVKGGERWWEGAWDEGMMA